MQPLQTLSPQASQSQRVVLEGAGANGAPVHIGQVVEVRILASAIPIAPLCVRHSTQRAADPLAVTIGVVPRGVSIVGTGEAAASDVERLAVAAVDPAGVWTVSSDSSGIEPSGVACSSSLLLRALPALRPSLLSGLSAHRSREPPPFTQEQP